MIFKNQMALGSSVRETECSCPKPICVYVEQYTHRAYISHFQPKKKAYLLTAICRQNVAFFIRLLPNLRNNIIIFRKRTAITTNYLFFFFSLMAFSDVGDRYRHYTHWMANMQEVLYSHNWTVVAHRGCKNCIAPFKVTLDGCGIRLQCCMYWMSVPDPMMS